MDRFRIASVKGFILYPLSILGGLILIPAGLGYGWLQCFYKKQLRTGLRNLNSKCFSLAGALDIYVNKACPELFNDLMLTTGSTCFFGSKLYLSDVYAANYYANTLTGLGRWIAKLLIKEKDRSFKSQ